MGYWVGRGPLSSVNYVKAPDRLKAAKRIYSLWMDSDDLSEVPEGWLESIREVSRGDFEGAGKVAIYQGGGLEKGEDEVFDAIVGLKTPREDFVYVVYPKNQL